MERIVAKFGGSSVADAGQIRKIAAIIDSDPRRSIVVVSAPGKRHGGESKLTDLLYLCQDMAAMATAITEPFGLIRDRYAEIVVELGLGPAVLADIDLFGIFVSDPALFSATTVGTATADPPAFVPENAHA